MNKFSDYNLLFENLTSYSIESSDNIRHYAQEIIIGDADKHYSTKYAIIVLRDSIEINSCVIIADGGSTAINKFTYVKVRDNIICAIGKWMVSLSIPDLKINWKIIADECTCFGVHLNNTDDILISHGELEISAFDFKGNKLWASSGKDIFTGNLIINGNLITVYDFDETKYIFDIKTGAQQVDAPEPATVISSALQTSHRPAR